MDFFILTGESVQLVYCILCLIFSQDCQQKSIINFYSKKVSKYSFASLKRVRKFIEPFQF